MEAYKDKGGRWYVSVRYKNWLGEQHEAIYITDENTRQNMINEYAATMASIPNSDALSTAHKKGSNDYLGKLDYLIDEFDVVNPGSKQHWPR